VKIIGTVNSTSRALFDASIDENTVAAMYVISHHTTQYGFIPLAAFVETAHKHGVPVVVDAAAEEHMLPDVIGTGADLVICSGHKHFRAPTSGVMAGRLDLIQAAYAQNRGIGRGMKIGKEGIMGLIVALEEWERGYHREQQEIEKQRVQRMVSRLAHLEGIQVTAVYPEPDPYPIMRARVTVDRERSGLTAMALSVLLGEGEPSIKTRAHHVEEGWFLLDPFNLSDADAEFICDRIEQIAALPMDEKVAAVQRLENLSVGDLFSRQGTWPHL
jgi:D-glucosaminate-6-phosphate ammonia-lyase